MVKENRKALDHDVRNPLLGIALEVRRMSKCMSRMEVFLTRIDKASNDAIRKWAKECSDFPNEVKKD